MTALIDLGTVALIFAGWFGLAILAALTFHALFGRKIAKPPRAEFSPEGLASATEEMRQQRLAETEAMRSFRSERDERLARASRRYGRAS